MQVRREQLVPSRPRVSGSQLRTAQKAVASLPKADRALLAKLGLRVTLVPTKSLEDGMLGATSIQGKGVESLAEVVQHEIGHALSVLRDQDRSEDAAHAYARKH